MAYGKRKQSRPRRRTVKRKRRGGFARSVRRVLAKSVETKIHYPFGQNGSEGVMGTIPGNTLVNNIPQAGGGARDDQHHRDGAEVWITGMCMRYSCTMPLHNENNGGQAAYPQANSFRIVVYTPKAGQTPLGSGLGFNAFIDMKKYHVYYDKITTLSSEGGPANKYGILRFNWHKGSRMGLKVQWTPSTPLSSGSITSNPIYIAMWADNNDVATQLTMDSNIILYFKDP